MDYKFLKKVLDQILSETRIDYSMEEIQFPFSTSSFSPLVLSSSSIFSFFSLSPLPFLFTKHCEDVYGLNEEETEYVWNNYRQIVKDKVRNNG